jgi:hypothetical protein
MQPRRGWKRKARSGHLVRLFASESLSSRLDASGGWRDHHRHPGKDEGRGRAAWRVAGGVGRWVVDFLRSTYNQATTERVTESSTGARGKERKRRERERERERGHPRPIPGLRRRTALEREERANRRLLFEEKEPSRRSPLDATFAMVPRGGGGEGEGGSRGTLATTAPSRDTGDSMVLATFRAKVNNGWLATAAASELNEPLRPTPLHPRNARDASTAAVTSLSG